MTALQREHTDAAGAVAGPHPARWPILAVVCLVQFAVVLDNTVLGVAIPSLGRALDADTAAVQWMVNAYSLAQVGLLLAAGAAADRYGRRRLLLTGLALFGAGSLAAALAHSSGQLIAARAGMGVGGALLVTSTLAVVMQVFDATERSRAIGVWAAVSALGFAAGPPIGGLLLAHFWWGALFLVNLPVVAIGLVAVRSLVPGTRNGGEGRPDLPGAALSTIAAACLVYAITTAPGHAWASAAVLLPTTLGLAALTGFVRWERRTRHPMLDPVLFRDRRFVGAVTGVLLMTFGSSGGLFLLTQQLQFVRGYSALEAGLRMAPFALGIVLLNFTGVAARLLARLGRPRAIALGMGLLAAGFGVIACRPDDGYGTLLPGLLLMGAGCALANPAIAEAVLSSIPPERAGVGAGMDGAMAELGSSLGVAVLGAVLSTRFTALTGADSLPRALAEAPTDSLRADTLHAFGRAVEATQLIGAAAVLAGGLVTAALLRRAARPGT
ncbi:MFS transporter [Kitasatospora sp. NBC_01302]|uniref:MFS transporter n=1 Tax=Kitasatospora sp. NBC_01302 TaxID=2903575 RepID=UPI002E0D78B4|nr:MFS transporter [Kitasatospora sp. NBC_01302]